MHIHIIGICGTFMGGLALIARELGHTVTGSDAGCYPPMSTQLEQQGITLFEGYKAGNLDNAPELVIIGNALSRGNEEVEAVLARGLRYTSGAQWLAEAVLYDQSWVLAVAGTHGKTSTTSMLAWILEYAGLTPGFLIGGVAGNFGISARLGKKPFFVIEADEYDTAFFDKRSKFIHYRPRTLILNNLEFDHADIFTDLAAIQTQFHFLVRTVPANGLIIQQHDDASLQKALDRGCWTPVERFGHGGAWQARELEADGSVFEVSLNDVVQGTVSWQMLGRFNMHNALAAIAAARHAGVPVKVALEALSGFKGIRRRLELRGDIDGIRVYDDFAHHPTAIALTIDALRKRIGNNRLVAVLEPRSNTMRMGVHRDQLADSLVAADDVVLVKPAALDWDMSAIVASLAGKARQLESVDDAVAYLAKTAQHGDHILIMSNGGFGGIHALLLEALARRS
ncbi:MAG: UDP-N-acetylmuramate:L-alanyl-gamma-D-glutamyl-meso-diaminopimelate ligase [Gammaproteobacteria bacterium]|nr:UDP-N-acetylmuramate:L-alanyl-gamma-D-glutamyl-meso-diaminopimelate ligase [Gammaproteobacteria bacterium]